MQLKPPVLISKTLQVSFLHKSQYHPLRENRANTMVGFFVTFSAQSGGIFVDMGVHDVSNPSSYHITKSNN